MKLREAVGLTEVLFVLGLIFVAAGLYFVYWPASPIVAGAILLAVAIAPYLRPGGKT